MNNPSGSASVTPWSRAVALIAVVVGAAVLAGWFLELAALKSVLPGLTTMRANTALTFVLTGLALWLKQSQRSPTERRAGDALAFLALLIAAATLLEHLSGADLGIDQLLIRDLESSGAAAPGPMAPATAASFVLLDAALLRLDFESTGGFRPSQWLALLTAGIALVALAAMATMSRLCTASALTLRWRCTARACSSCSRWACFGRGLRAA
jgi:two-component system cell cycle sensor histidine kinase/response regulator CckA